MFLTVLQQDNVGGLQVKYGEDWVDVKPVSGALIINVGDLLQVNQFYSCEKHQTLVISVT